MAVMSNQNIHSQSRTIDGLSIRYAESEPRDDHALLLSPWPESIYCYEPTWNRLAEHTHLVAIDLPGFGQSERRDSLMSPRAMGEFIVRVADAFGLEQPHVVGPDVGTGASLFAAALYPGRFRSLVVGTGGAAVPASARRRAEGIGGSAEPRALSQDRRTPDVIKTLERYTLTDAAREDYLKSFEGERFAESMHYVRTYPEQLPILSDLLPTIQTPVLIIAGARDPVVPRSTPSISTNGCPRASSTTWVSPTASSSVLVKPVTFLPSTRGLPSGVLT